MRYKIAYLTSKNPLDKKVASGVYHYQSASLKKHCGEIYYLGPVKNIIITLIIKASHFLQRLTGKKYNKSHSKIISKIYGRVFSEKLNQGNYDFIFADKSSCEIANLNTKVPLIYSTDATFGLLHNYYPLFSRLFGFSVKESHGVEQDAINNASLIIVASAWAAESVVKDYNFPFENVHVLPRGANIDRIPSRNLIDERKKTGTCRLLYMGYEWHRKGYDIAYETMGYIRSQGIPVKLVVIGFSPPVEFVDEDVEIINYIDKNSREGIKMFDKLMVDADFFLLPTRAECMGIAFCEASAYGLPVITRDTGGVTEVVKNGINGYALDYDSDYREFGNKIISIYNSDKEYYNLVRSSRRYFEERLNWDAWGFRMKQLLDTHFASSLAETGDETPAGRQKKHISN